MLNKVHPARSSRILSLGLSTSALFGMVTVFSINQISADKQALADQKFLQAIEAAQAQLNQSQVTTKTKSAQPTTSASTSTQSSTTQQSSTQVTSDVAATVITDVAPAVAPQPDPVVVAPAPVAPAPASNTTSGGSK